MSPSVGSDACGGLLLEAAAADVASRWSRAFNAIALVAAENIRPPTIDSGPEKNHVPAAFSFGAGISSTKGSVTPALEVTRRIRTHDLHTDCNGINEVGNLA